MLKSFAVGRAAIIAISTTYLNVLCNIAYCDVIYHVVHIGGHLLGFWANLKLLSLNGISICHGKCEQFVVCFFCYFLFSVLFLCSISGFTVVVVVVVCVKTKKKRNKATGNRQHCSLSTFFGLIYFIRVPHLRQFSWYIHLFQCGTTSCIWVHSVLTITQNKWVRPFLFVFSSFNGKQYEKERMAIRNWDIKKYVFISLLHVCVQHSLYFQTVFPFIFAMCFMPSTERG